MRMPTILFAVVACCLLAAGADAQEQDITKPFTLHQADLEWTRHGIHGGWVEISFLYTDPESGGQMLLLRHSLGANVPKHWHSADEKNVCLSGAMTFEDEEGWRTTLGSGDFGFIPGGVVHQAWASEEETTVCLITVDKAFDVNWVEPPRQVAGQDEQR